MPYYHALKSYDSDKADWIARRLLTLRHDLAQQIVNDRRPDSLIVGTWNIRAFDGGMPRLDESFHYIAEIISTFDICAVQELKPDLAPIRRLEALLGPNWDYILTDVSTHEGGNSERMGIFFNKDKVFFRNLVGEIVVPSDALPSGHQIARTPFFAAFQASWFRFTLCSTHIVYGDDLDLRAKEVAATAESLVKRAKVEDQVFIMLGDMNIERDDGPVMAALKGSDMVLAPVPKSNLAGTKPYDQIAYTEMGASTRKTRLLRSGGFDWRGAVFGPPAPLEPGAPADPPHVERLTLAAQQLHYEPIVTAQRQAHGKDPYVDFAASYTRWMTNEMSDHLPVWVELEVDYSDQYLGRFVAG